MKDGALVTRAIGHDPVIDADRAALGAGERPVLRGDRDGLGPDGNVRVFWATKADMEQQPQGAYPFTEGRVRNVPIDGGGETQDLPGLPGWNGTLANLRIDLPPGASVRIDSIRIVELPESTQALRRGSEEAGAGCRSQERRSSRCIIPWENLSDIVPKAAQRQKPGLYLSTDIGFDRRPDFFRLGVVFTVQAQEAGGKWRTIFRRALERRTTGWEHWDIPLGRRQPSNVKLRFTTDSYSRAQDRNAPSWKWAIWGQPQVVEVTADGKRRVRYDFVKQIDSSKAFVRLDNDGKEREFDGKGKDSTGATFACVSPGTLQLLKPGEGRTGSWSTASPSGQQSPPHKGQYRCYLGGVDSGWAYGAENGEALVAHRAGGREEDNGCGVRRRHGLRAGQGRALVQRREAAVVRHGESRRIRDGKRTAWSCATSTAATPAARPRPTASAASTCWCSRPRR